MTVITKRDLKQPHPGWVDPEGWRLKCPACGEEWAAATPGATSDWWRCPQGCTPEPVGDARREDVGRLRAICERDAALLAPHRREVVPALATGTSPGRYYASDAYRRAWEYASREDPTTASEEAALFVAGSRLVHGVHRHKLPVSGRLWRKGDAWVELADALTGQGALVFSPVLQDFYDRAGYCDTMGAIAERRYTVKEAAQAMLAANTFGPWHRGTRDDEPDA
jgi:hypothetical protein